MHGRFLIDLFGGFFGLFVLGLFGKDVESGISPADAGISPVAAGISPVASGISPIA